MAVVSQPYNRAARIPAPGKVDASLGEFWVENPWDIALKHNLSSYERKRAYLNVPDPAAPGGLGRAFLDISHLTGADNDGDGRAAIAADFRNDGRLDLVVRQVSGGPVHLYENQFPRRHYLKVSLRGRPQPGVRPTSNRQGIGARLVATVQGRQLVRELYPHNTFRSQAPNIVHFGLADADRVERLVIRWPSGYEQVQTNLAADRHIVVEEGKDSVETVVPGQTIQP